MPSHLAQLLDFFCCRNKKHYGRVSHMARIDGTGGLETHRSKNHTREIFDSNNNMRNARRRIKISDINILLFLF